MLHAAGAQQRLYVERYAVVAERALSRARVRLVAGHRGRAVVEDYYRDVRPLVDGVDYAEDSGVEEGRVADEGEALRARLGQREPLGERYARAHAEAGVDHVERRGVAERVAADVAAVDRFFAVLRRDLRLVERSAVRAARAEHRRTHGKLRKLGRGLGFGGEAEIFRKRRLYQLERIFAVPRHVAAALAEYRNAARRFDEELLFDDGVELFEHEHGIRACEEVLRELLGHRVGRADFVERRIRAEFV